MFGSEPPLYLKPVGRRGLRRHEADVLQHYPGYRNPIEQTPGSEGYASEARRLHPTLTAAQELRHDRTEASARHERAIVARRAQRAERERELARRRGEEFEAEQRHIEAVTGLSLRNEPGDGMDTVTRQYRSVDARHHHEYKSAQEEHAYFARQRRLVQKNNPCGYNIITGERTPEVMVPPMPQKPPPTEFLFR